MLPSDQNASGRSFGEEERKALAEVLAAGTLISTKGSVVKELESEFAAWLGVRHAVACSSGTAAVHTALAALDLEPGDEVITTPITDMGALTPILYQGLIPVFADVDPSTGLLDPASVEDRIGPRTRAVIATHLFGHPGSAEPLARVAADRGLALIEDCAQAYGASTRGRKVGTFGALACFSLQQGKHITCGEGGLVVTGDDRLARRCRLFVNKAWPYGEPDPDHEFLAPNYRMTELQGAVALAQLRKLDRLLDARTETAEAFCRSARNLRGVAAPVLGPEDRHAYWRIPLTVSGDATRRSLKEVARDLQRAGIAASAGYTGRPAFACRLFREQATFGRSRYPFTLARPEAVDYRPERFPGTMEFIRRVLVIGWNERMDHEDTRYVLERLEEALGQGGR